MKCSLQGGDAQDDPLTLGIWKLGPHFALLCDVLPHPEGLALLSDGPLPSAQLVKGLWRSHSHTQCFA